MTDKPFDYMVVTNPSSHDLANAVVHWAKDGWRPCGGVAFAPHPDSAHTGRWFLFAQAMTKTED